MKEQYVGDVNDYRKYALLRYLATQADVRIGVCWMFTSPEAGNLRDYLAQPDKWREHDPAVFDQLRAILEPEGASRLARIEQSGIIPNARFFNKPMPKSIKDREHYFEDASKYLGAADLIFFDPDNGISRNIPVVPAQAVRVRGTMPCRIPSIAPSGASGDARPPGRRALIPKFGAAAVVRRRETERGPDGGRGPI